jgi:hypothetical protein
MPFMYAYAETVTLIRRVVTGQDADGNDAFSSTESLVQGAVFLPAGSTEQVQGQDQVVTDPTFMWVNNVPTVKAIDAIRRTNGDLFEVVGDPGDAQSPFSSTRVLTVRTRKVTG